MWLSILYFIQDYTLYTMVCICMYIYLPSYVYNASYTLRICLTSDISRLNFGNVLESLHHSMLFLLFTICIISLIGALRRNAQHVVFVLLRAFSLPWHWSNRWRKGTQNPDPWLISFSHFTQIFQCCLNARNSRSFSSSIQTTISWLAIVNLRTVIECSLLFRDKKYTSYQPVLPKQG